MSLIEKFIGRAAPSDDGCAVDTCDATADIDIVDLKPIDPIDHDETYVPLCATHREWAERRNAFADEIAERLRDARREIGMDERDRVQELRNPPDGEIADGMSMSTVAQARDLMGDMLRGEGDE